MSEFLKCAICDQLVVGSPFTRQDGMVIHTRCLFEWWQWLRAENEQLRRDLERERNYNEDVC